MNHLDLLEKAPVFQLKGSMLAITILELSVNDPDSLDAQLAVKVEQAPQFFQDAPIILALDKCTAGAQPFDIALLLSICRKHGLHPLALRSEQSEHLAFAKAHGLTAMPPSGARERLLEASQAPESTTKLDAEPSFTPAKIITQPVRSGQQIYAKNTDLIVMAAVSAGAELLADGNIHVYGPLRGRALAGINGYMDARIYCQQLGAEMLSIAGQYKLAEDLRRDPLWGQATQTRLNDQHLEICTL